MLTPAQITSQQFNQSLWYDNVQRGAIADGTFAKLVAVGVRGCTSNPSIFHKAIADSTDYDEALRELVPFGLDATELYYRLVVADIRAAADVFRSVYNESKKLDGYVSVEVLPRNCHSAEESVQEGLELFHSIGRPNVMIKIPATEAGLDAITQLTGKGISVNATLIFSQAQYLGVARAYIKGLKIADSAGLDLSGIASVASFFVSRIDQQVDARLQLRGPAALQGKVAIANAKLAYASFEKLFATDDARQLCAKGAQKQRLLWASTGTKNPSYPDTLYVDGLIGAETVNTLPPSTFEAFQDHGTPQSSLGADLEAAAAMLRQLAESDISLDTICQDLLRDGLAAFSDAMDALMAVIDTRRKELLI